MFEEDDGTLRKYIDEQSSKLPPVNALPDIKYNIDTMDIGITTICLPFFKKYIPIYYIN